MASPLTVWSTTADGHIYGQDTTYATARSTASTVDDASSTFSIGQYYAAPTFRCYEGFVSFDTSSVGAASTVTVATLSLYGSANNSDTDFVLEARIKDWGAGLTTGDWVAGDNLDDCTRVATWNTSSGWSTAAYTDLTSESSFLTNVAQSGTTYLVLDSDRQVAGTETPTQYERVSARAAEDATGGGGTDRDPKLYVEWTEGGGTTQTEAGAATVTVTAAGAEALTKSEGGSSSFSLTASGTAELYVAPEAFQTGAFQDDYFQTFEAEAANAQKGDAAFAIAAAGSESISATEAGASSFSIAAAGAEGVSKLEAGASSFAVAAAGTAGARKLEAGASSFAITAAGASQVTQAEAGAATAAFTASGTVGIIDFVASEAGDASFAVTAAGAEALLRPEAGDSSFSITAAGAETATKLEAGSAAFSITAEGTVELAEASNAASGDAAFSITAAGAEQAVYVEAGTASFAVTASGSLSVAEYEATEAGAASFAITAAGAETLTKPEAGAAAFAIAASGAADVTEYVATEAGDASFAVAAAGAEQLTATEAGAAAFSITETGAVGISEGGTVKSEEGAASFALTAAGASAATQAESGAAAFALTESGAEALQVAETGAAAFAIAAAGEIGYVPSSGTVQELAGDATFAVTAEGAAEYVKTHALGSGRPWRDKNRPRPKSQKGGWPEWLQRYQDVGGEAGFGIAAQGSVGVMRPAAGRSMVELEVRGDIAYTLYEPHGYLEALAEIDEDLALIVAREQELIRSAA